MDGQKAGRGGWGPRRWPEVYMLDGSPFSAGIVQTKAFFAFSGYTLFFIRTSKFILRLILRAI